MSKTAREIIDLKQEIVRITDYNKQLTYLIKQRDIYNKELEKKLEIAVKALKFYAEMENVECFGYCGDTNREHYLDIEAVIEDDHTAQQALKEIKE